MSKVITRIKGGLGNQLFCYAAARRLALMNNVELVIDDVTGFVRDHQYQRHYSLDHFMIPIRKATPSERMEPFERYRRGVAKYIARIKPFDQRSYLEQDGNDFDARLLDYKVTGTVYLDGYWQSEDYFKDVEQIIREDLRIVPPEDNFNKDMAEKIQQCHAVAVHVRWFDLPDCKTVSQNASQGYYHRAIEEVSKNVKNPHFFLFSDEPLATQRSLCISADDMTSVNHNKGDKYAYADLWLMTQCKHFIIANSTFSWWGAWLANSDSNNIIAPDIKLASHTSWGFTRQVPESWIKLQN